jgi:hypothetical protein
MAIVIANTLFAFKAECQTADAIVKRHIQAMGGEEKIGSLKSIEMEGTLRWEDYDIPLKASLVNNFGQRYDITVLKTSGYIILSQKGGWEYLPFRGMKKPEPLSQAELRLYMIYTDLQGYLSDYKKKGHTIMYDGLETIDDIACYKLSIKLSQGTDITSYIDTSTFYIVRTRVPTQLNGKSSFFEISYSNFQTTPEGYILPYAFTLGPGTAFINKVFVNKEIDLSIFEPGAENTGQ